MSKYAPFLQYVIDNILTTRVTDLAEHIGVTPDALKKQITLWRKSGIKVPGKRIRKIGHISTRTDRGRVFQMVKTKTGWVRTGVQPRTIAPRKKVVPERLTKKAVKINYNTSAAKPKPYQTMDHDLSQKVAVNIPKLRMTVYVAPGADVEQIRAKYLNRKAI